MKEEGLIIDTIELILKEVQVILSFGYVLSIGIGMFFQYERYTRFGINIFDYASVFDFLIAPFQDTRIIGFVAISLCISLIVFVSDNLWRRKFPKSYSSLNFGLDKKPWFAIYRFLLFTVLFLTYIQLGAKFYGKSCHENRESLEQVKVEFADQSSLKGQILGKTGNEIFLLVDEKVRVIPTNGLVKQIIFD